jgi:hypothetical protein
LVKTGLGKPVFVRERSAKTGVGVGVGVSVGAGGVGVTALTLVVVVPKLLAGFGSVVEDETTAVFVKVEGLAAVTLTVIVTVATFRPTGSVPRLAVTVPLVPGAGPVQVFTGTVTHETNVVPLGIGSFKITATAGSGPPLLTLSV